ncbi:hypothetical protein H0H92_011703, partial [Tricholoma furcatifolium]
ALLCRPLCPPTPQQHPLYPLTLHILVYAPRNLMPTGHPLRNSSIGCRAISYSSPRNWRSRCPC